MDTKIEKLLAKRHAAEADYQLRLAEAKTNMDAAEQALNEITASKTKVDFEDFRKAKNLFRDTADYYEILLNENTNPTPEEIQEYRETKSKLVSERASIYSETLRKLEKPVAQIEKILNEAVTDQQTVTGIINDLTFAFENKHDGISFDPLSSVKMNRVTGGLLQAVTNFNKR